MEEPRDSCCRSSHPRRGLVTDITLWTECYSSLVVVLRYKSLKSLPVQSVLRVPVLFPFFLLHLKAKVLQLQLANAVPGFVLRRLSAFPQQKQQNQQFIVARAICIMYYGRSCVRNGYEAGRSTKTAQKLPFRCTNGSSKLFYDL